MKRRSARLAWSARLTLWGPSLAAGLTALALFGPGAERPVRWARLYGGPSLPTVEPSRARLAWLVQTFTSAAGEDAEPAPMSVELHGGDDTTACTGRTADTEPTPIWSGATEPDGTAEVAATLSGGLPRCVWLREPAGGLLAAGATALGGRYEDDSPLGGWQGWSPESPPRVRWAIAQGALTVPFSGELWLELDASGPMPLELELVGAEWPAPPPTVFRPAERVRLAIRPEEHHVSLRITTMEKAERRGLAFAALPVVAGAIAVEQTGSILTLRSPIGHTVAYVAIVSPAQRWWGSRVSLTADATGSSGTLGLPALGAAGPLWAVVSPSPDKRTAASVGWPLQPWEANEADEAAAVAGPPPFTFSPPERLLLDGERSARALERDRRARVRRVCAALIAALAVGVAFDLRRPKLPAAAAHDLVLQHALGASDRQPLLGALCILLGMGALVLFLLWAAP